MSHHYSRNDVVEALRRLGIREGDTVFSHNNVGFLGRMAEAGQPADYYAQFKAAFLEVLGESGTLVMPTFSYSFCKQQVFDVQQTPGVCGFLSEALRQDPEAVRSHDANFSVAALGARAHQLTRDVPDHSFGPDSFWERFLHAGGKFCNLNFDAGSTFIHYVEKRLNVPYRYDKAFTGTLIDRSQPRERTFYHFVYDLDQPGHGPEFTEFDSLAKTRGIARAHNLGKGQVLVLGAEDTFALIEAELKTNPTLLIADKKLKAGV